MLSSKFSLASMLAAVVSMSAGSAIAMPRAPEVAPRKTTKNKNFSKGYGRAYSGVSRDKNRNWELLTERYKAVEKYNREVYREKILTRTGRVSAVNFQS